MGLTCYNTETTFYSNGLPMPTSPTDRFLKEYSKWLDVREAAFIAGAGLSVLAGLKNWVELFRDMADELNLDIDKENNLVALVQFHFNKHKIKTRLNQLRTDEYGKDVPITENHRLIASLPIETVWSLTPDSGYMRRALTQMRMALQEPRLSLSGRSLEPSARTG